jgi:hypothetical protein
VFPNGKAPFARIDQRFLNLNKYFCLAVHGRGNDRLKQSFKTKLKQIWFPPDFRLPVPEFTKEQIDLLEELLQLIHPTLSRAEQTNRDDKVHMANFLVDLGTGIWRIRRKIEGLTRMPKEIRDALYSLESTWMSMSEGGVEIVDHIGTIPNRREANVVEVREIPNLAREQVIETVKPTILLRGEVIQTGEVVIGRPAGKPAQAGLPADADRADNEDAALTASEPPYEPAEADPGGLPGPVPAAGDSLSDLTDKLERELQGTLFSMDGIPAVDAPPALPEADIDVADAAPQTVIDVESAAPEPAWDMSEAQPETADAPDPVSEAEGSAAWLSDSGRELAEPAPQADEHENTHDIPTIYRGFYPTSPPEEEAQVPEAALQSDVDSGGAADPGLIPAPEADDTQPERPAKSAMPKIYSGFFSPIGQPPVIGINARESYGAAPSKAFEASDSGENTEAGTPADEAGISATPQNEETPPGKPKRAARKPRQNTKSQQTIQEPQGNLSGSSETKEADNVG